MTVIPNGDKSDSYCKVETTYCEHCNNHATGDKCCWATAMEIKRFQKKVKHKYIIEVIFDMIISMASVTTDLLALIFYFIKKKYTFAILTAIPVLLPTFVFTNVYLADESDHHKASRMVSSISRKNSNNGKRRCQTKEEWEGEPSGKEKVEPCTNSNEGEDRTSCCDSESTDSSIRPMNNKESRCRKACFFHWTCISKYFHIMGGCVSGCFHCFCNRDHRLRRTGAVAVKNSLQRMFKYGVGTFVLRIIAWMWYVKALIFGVKAYKQPKKFMHIEAPDTHWSYELLVRLDFLQAALENAPQCVIQLYALITQPDEDVVLGMLTLILSFIDFIRVAVSVHWDLQKGPVNAPSGCYKTLTWKAINTSSWIFIYAARSAAIALVVATGLMDQTNKASVIYPLSVLLIHVIVFGKILSRTEFGVAAQKIVTTVFISLFFLPELDSTVSPQTAQLYYAAIIIQNTFFILPWNGFEQEYCITKEGIVESPRTTVRPRLPSPPSSPFPNTTWRPTSTIYDPTITIRDFVNHQITASTSPAPDTDHGCLIDPVWISLAVPTMTVFGVIFRLVSSKKMYDYKTKLPEKYLDHTETQQKLETSIGKLFSKNWTQMTAGEMLRAFLRMLKKEVIIVDKSGNGDVRTNIQDGKTKRFSLLAARLQVDFLASQTFIRESFSLMTRTTRSHDINMGLLTDKEVTPPAEYNSDSELTLRNSKAKKRPRIPMSRNVSESLDVPTPTPSSPTTFVEVDMSNGTQFLEMCWI